MIKFAAWTVVALHPVFVGFVLLSVYDLEVILVEGIKSTNSRHNETESVV